MVCSYWPWAINSWFLLRGYKDPLLGINIPSQHLEAMGSVCCISYMAIVDKTACAIIWPLWGDIFLFQNQSLPGCISESYSGAYRVKSPGLHPLGVVSKSWKYFGTGGAQSLCPWRTPKVSWIYLRDQFLLIYWRNQIDSRVFFYFLDLTRDVPEVVLTNSFQIWFLYYTRKCRKLGSLHVSPILPITWNANK